MEEADRPRRWVWTRRVLGAGSLLGLAGLAYSFWDPNAWAVWMESARPVPFFTAMAVLPALGLPLTPFFLAAGATFGARVGILGSALALGWNLTMCYWIARGALRPRFASLVRRLGRELPDLSEGRRDALRFTLIVKLTPGLPGFVKNYGLAVAGVPFPLYFVGSMLFTGGYALALVLLGDSLLEHDLRRTLVAGGALLLLVMALLSVRARRRARAPSVGAP